MQQPLSSSKRITSIDLLRGTVMIIMALDHVRDYFHADAFLYDPLDLTKTSAALFFTRWITHFCAPVFIFLAGTSALLSGQKKSKKELSIFLLKRGAWLIFLELTVIGFLWNFDVDFTSFYFTVIWALGISMIFLGALIHLQVTFIFLIGILLVVGHNLFDQVHVSGNSIKTLGWGMLHEQLFFTWQGKNVLVGYPVLPWIGVMALGYCFGTLFTSVYSEQQRKKLLLRIGGTAVALFIVLRLINIYGDPVPWSVQSSPFYTFLSFIKANKYPPSLLYLLMTLGPAILFLAFAENRTNKSVKIISVYGRVPMFYYLIHILLIHLFAMLAAELFTGFSWTAWILKQPLWFATGLKGYGFSLPVVYLVWLIIVIILYPLCKRYDRYKMNHKEKWWLSYL